MINVFICDDEAVFIDIISEKTHQIMSEMNKKCSVMGFRKSSDFIEAVKSGQTVPHIVFLDIFMPECSGHEAAVILKKKYPECKLVFISSHEEEVFDAFDYNANGFISKFRFKEKFASTLRRLILETEANQPASVCFTVCSEDGSIEKVCLEYSDIIFAECIMKKVFITTIDGKCRLIRRGTWHEITERLSGPDFVIPHNNYIINMQHINIIKDDSVYMEYGNKCIAISKHRKREFMAKFNEYTFTKEEHHI